MNNTSVEKLVPARTSSPKSNSYKFKLSCQERITEKTPSTIEWLKLMEQFDHESENVKIFKALLDSKKTVVTKVGFAKNGNSEYQIGKLLQQNLKLPIIMSFYCKFSCMDSFQKIEANNGLCGTKPRHADNISVIVMPFCSLGRIDRFNWNRTNIDVYKSVLKHVVCTLLYTFESNGFNHNDLHMGNILLKQTKKTAIQYGSRKELLIHGGLLPVLMDFERSQTCDSALLLFSDIGRFLNLAGTEIDVKLDMNNSILNKCGKTRVTQNTYDVLCDYIDSRSIKFVTSEVMEGFKIERSF
jgi:hypothetical protein